MKKQKVNQEEKLVSKTHTDVETYQNKYGQTYVVTTVWYSDKSRKLYVKFI